MADDYPFLVKGDDRQRVGRSTPYFRELLERGYSIEGDPAPAEPEENDTTSTEDTEEVESSGDDQP